MTKEEFEDVEPIEDEAEVAEDQPDQDDDGESGNDDRDYESEALAMGWVPQDKFKGDPGKWSDAKTFVERGENFIPFIQADRKKLQEELSRKEADFDSRLKRMEAMTAKREAAIRKRYEQEIEDIRTQQREAVESGDVDTFERLERRREALESTKPEDEKTPDDRETTEKQWIEQNPWYKDDFDLHQTANQYSQFLARNNPSLSMSDNLRQTETYIKEKFPEKFGSAPAKPKRKTPPVDGNGMFPAGKANGKSYSDLPAEAKTLCDQDVKDGLFKDQNEWVKEYFANA